MKRYWIVMLARYACFRRKEVFIDYDSSHRVDFRVLFPRLPERMDCSEFISWCYWNARVKQDPSGNDWNDAYTRDMWENGTEVSLLEAKPGDLVFYDSPTTHSHVALYLGNGRVMSKGNDDGPVEVSIYYRNDLKFIRSYL